MGWPFINNVNARQLEAGLKQAYQLNLTIKQRKLYLSTQIY